MQALHPPAEYFRGDHYPEYFKTRHWLELNQKLVFSNRNAQCFICAIKVVIRVKEGRVVSNLLIHHVSYENLFCEVLTRDVYVLCFDCHTRVHFHKHNGEKVPLVTKILVRRMKILKYTYGIRNFRFGSFLNSLF